MSHLLTFSRGRDIRQDVRNEARALARARLSMRRGRTGVRTSEQRCKIADTASDETVGRRDANLSE
jgi:hypothetical protein